MTSIVKAKVTLPADIMKELSTEVESIQKRLMSPTGNRIRITQKKTFRMPSGEEGPGPIFGVILDFIVAHYYYTGAYDPEDIQPPECFALGTDISTMIPHVEAPVKQAETCSICPQNQFGSAVRGRGKACNNCRLLAVLPPDATEDTPIMLLRVSPTAIRSFDAYVSSILRTFKTPPVAVVTEFSFDPAPDYASLRFGNPQPNPIIELCMARRDEARKILLTPPEVKLPVEAPKGKAGSRKAK